MARRPLGPAQPAQPLQPVQPGCVYEKVTDYHIALRQGDPAVINPRGKSKCAADISLEVAQQMLDESVAAGRVSGVQNGLPKQIFALREDIWYRALPHRHGRYHGCPVEERKVPPPVRRLA